MSEIVIKNAIIERTSLGYEDHGIMTCSLHLNYGGSCQGFGGYGFSQYDKELKKSVGTAWGCEFIMRVLKTVGVENWEDLIGKNIRVKKEEWGKIYAIGNIIEDDWFDPEEIKTYLKEQESK